MTQLRFILTLIKGVFYLEFDKRKKNIYLKRRNITAQNQNVLYGNTLYNIKSNKYNIKRFMQNCHSP